MFYKHHTRYKMRKKRNCIAFILTIILCIFFAGCGKKQQGNGTDKNMEGSLSKINVYRMQPYKFADLLENIKYYSINGITKGNDKIYMLASLTNGNESSMKMVSMTQDGSQMQATDIQLWMNGINPHSGKKNVNSQDAYEYINITRLNISSAGTLYGIKNYDYSDYSNSDNPITISEQYICAWNEKGTMLWETKLETMQGEDNSVYVQGMIPLKEEGVLLLFSGNKPGKLLIDKHGNAGTFQELNSETRNIIQNCNTVILGEDETFYIIYSDADDYNKWYIAVYDALNDMVKKKTELPSNITYGGLSCAVYEGADNLLYTNSEGVYRYHIGDSEAKQIMNFVNSDIAITYFEALLPLDKEHFIAFYNETDPSTYDSTPVVGLFNKVKPEEIPDKKELVLAGSNIDWQLRSRVVAFNRQSSEYRIIIKNYGTENSYEDNNAGITKLNMDIMTGDIPDILVIDNNIDIRKYADKGILADVGKLIEQDADLSQLKYMNNVFDSCRINGTLYEIVPSFSIKTYVGKEAVVGNRNGWTMSEAQDILKKMPEESRLFAEMTKSSFLSEMMNYCGRSFIDLNTGKCDFDNAQFKAMLEYADSLPEEIDYSQSENNGFILNGDTQYRQGSTLLAECYFNQPIRYQELKYGQFGEAIRLIGFPGTGGNGSILQIDTTYAFSSKSKNLDAAWNFMKYYLTKEYQSSISYMLPVLEEQLKLLVSRTKEKPFYLDDNGNKVEYDATYWVGGEEIKLPPLNQEETNEVLTFIRSVNTRGYTNENIFNIINEEAAAYFAGQKDVETTASLIQNRVQLFVNENR